MNQMGADKNGNVRMKNKKRIPFWLALIIGYASTGILLYLYLFLFRIGGLNKWVSLQNPPLGVNHIISAIGSTILVEANDEKPYFYDFSCSEYEKYPCKKWNEGNGPSFEGMDYSSKRGPNCSDLGKGLFPFNPSGEISECIYTRLLSDLEPWFDDTYVTLMTDGRINYWTNGGSLLDDGSDFFVSAFIYPWCSVPIVTLIYFVISRYSQRKGDQ